MNKISVRPCLDENLPRGYDEVDNEKINHDFTAPSGVETRGWCREVMGAMTF